MTPEPKNITGTGRAASDQTILPVLLMKLPICTSRIAMKLAAAIPLGLGGLFWATHPNSLMGFLEIHQLYWMTDRRE